jgi:hypothetical protein
MSDPLRNIYIDDRMESYNGYVPDDWSEKTFGLVTHGSALDNLLVDLLLTWRTTAYTACMPAVLIKSIQSSTLGYAEYAAPDASVVAFGDNILAKLSRTVPELVADRKLRAKLMEGLVTLAADFRDTRAKVSPQLPIEPIWQDFLKQDAFAMSIWSSQRVSYVAFYNAYESFLVDCAKLALGTSQLRATDKDFKEALRSGFACDISVSCWMHSEMNIAKLVRHALSHAGGRETADLVKQKHGIKLIGGVLQIVPHDNHNLLRRLRVGVEEVVGVSAADPKFA